jgi:hypothetical protein
MTHGTVQWKYKTVRPPREGTRKQATDPKAELNKLGAEGWELVKTIEYVGGGTMYLVSKRSTNSGEGSV